MTDLSLFVLALVKCGWMTGFIPFVVLAILVEKFRGGQLAENWVVVFRLRRQATSLPRSKSRRCRETWRAA